MMINYTLNDDKLRFRLIKFFGLQKKKKRRILYSILLYKRVERYKVHYNPHYNGHSHGDCNVVYYGDCHGVCNVDGDEMYGVYLIYI